MATDTQGSRSTLDTAFSLVSVAVVAVSIWAFYAFDELHGLIRTGGLLAACAAGIAIFMQTSYGRICWEYMKGARVELRRVIWPTRKETMQTTGMILVVVLIVALGLWGVDSILIVLLELFMGTRG